MRCRYGRGTRLLSLTSLTPLGPRECLHVTGPLKTFSSGRTDVLDPIHPLDLTLLIVLQLFLVLIGKVSSFCSTLPYTNEIRIRP